MSCGRRPGRLVDQLEVHILERVLRLADRQHVRARGHKRACRRGCCSACVRDVKHIRGWGLLAPCTSSRKSREYAPRISERYERSHRKRLGEQLLAKLIGTAYRPQCS